MLNRENINQVVLFDLDDTLLKTKELMRAILTRLENVYGLENDALATHIKILDFLKKSVIKLFHLKI